MNREIRRMLRVTVGAGGRERLWRGGGVRREGLDTNEHEFNTNWEEKREAELTTKSTKVFEEDRQTMKCANVRP
jgi:hypothetical protein